MQTSSSASSRTRTDINGWPPWPISARGRRTPKSRPPPATIPLETVSSVWMRLEAKRIRHAVESEASISLKNVDRLMRRIREFSIGEIRWPRTIRSSLHLSAQTTRLRQHRRNVREEPSRIILFRNHAYRTYETVRFATAMGNPCSGAFGPRPHPAHPRRPQPRHRSDSLASDVY